LRVLKDKLKMPAQSPTEPLSPRRLTVLSPRKRLSHSKSSPRLFSGAPTLKASISSGSPPASPPKPSNLTECMSALSATHSGARRSQQNITNVGAFPEHRLQHAYSATASTATTTPITTTVCRHCNICFYHVYQYYKQQWHQWHCYYRHSTAHLGHLHNATSRNATRSCYNGCCVPTGSLQLVECLVIRIAFTIGRFVTCCCASHQSYQHRTGGFASTASVAAHGLHLAYHLSSWC
jgi:hypothetical protein